MNSKKIITYIINGALLLGMIVGLSGCKSTQNSETIQNSKTGKRSKNTQKNKSSKVAKTSSNSESDKTNASKNEHEKSSSSSQDINDVIKTRNITKIGIMLYQYQYSDDDITKEPDFGCYKVNGSYFASNGGPIASVRYQLDGNTIKYSKKQNGTYPEFSSMGLGDLEGTYYATKEQISFIDSMANKIGNPREENYSDTE